ncbi:MAG: hypothetical protein ACYDHP_07360 [Ferrimicrobium sp.]
MPKSGLLAAHKVLSSRATIAYAQVSTAGKRTIWFAKWLSWRVSVHQREWTHEVICDVGSALNYHRGGFDVDRSRSKNSTHVPAVSVAASWLILQRAPDLIAITKKAAPGYSFT